MVQLYFDGKLSMLRSGRKSRLTLERIGRVYGWNDKPVASITDDDAAAMLHDIADQRGKKSMANQTKHIVHAMFKWAKQPGRKFVTVNPFADLAAPGGAKVTRDRFLSAAEIRQIWSALEKPERFDVSQDAATALRLILVTAARPGMVRGMVGSELRDLKGPSEHGPHWSLPAERMKAGSAFITPLSGLALELLRPHLKADPGARLFRTCRTGPVARSRATPCCRARDGAMDAARPSADRRNDSGPGGLLARTDRRAARAYPKGRDGGLRPMGQVRSSARDDDGRRAVAARDAGRRIGEGDQGRSLDRYTEQQHDERAAIEPPFSFRTATGRSNADTLTC